MTITKIPIIQINKNGTIIEVNPTTPTNNIGISSGTLKLNTSIVDRELSFGELISSQFSVQLFNIDDNLEGCDIQLFLEEDGVRTSKFKGIIDSSKRDNIGGYRDIIAYDWVYYNRDYDISNWWNNFWTNTRTSATIQEIRQSLITYLGFVNDSKTYVNDSIIIPNNFNFYSDLKLNTIFKMICELQAVFPHIDENGNMEFISITNTNTSDLTGLYEGNNSKWEDYTTELITGIGIYSTSNDLSQLIGTTDNVYNISGNLFALTLDAQTLNTLGNNILSAISGIQFTPSKIKMIFSDFDLKLGQRINTPKGYGYVMTNSLSGVCLIEQTIESKSMGSKLSQRVDSRNDTLIEGAKMSKFEQTIDGFTTEVSRIDRVATQASNDASTALSTSITAQSQVTQMADNIVLKVDNNGNIVKVALSADASTGSTFKVTADNISFFSNGVMELSANNLQINSTNFSVDASGNITAVSGTIGGFTIDSTSIRKGALTNNSSGNIGISSMDFNRTINGTNRILRFAIGSKFGVTSNGTIYASNANLYGSLTSESSTLKAELTSASLKFYQNNNLVGALTPVSYNGTYTGSGNNGYKLATDTYGYYLSLGSNKNNKSYIIMNDGLNPDGCTAPIILAGDTRIYKILLADDGNSYINDGSYTYNNVTYNTVNIEPNLYVGGLTRTNNLIVSGDVLKDLKIVSGMSIQLNNATASRVAIFNGSKWLASSSITTTQLGYLSGATSNIQTQLNTLNSSLTPQAVTFTPGANLKSGYGSVTAYKVGRICIVSFDGEATGYSQWTNYVIGTLSVTALGRVYTLAMNNYGTPVACIQIGQGSNQLLFRPLNAVLPNGQFRFNLVFVTSS